MIISASLIAVFIYALTILTEFGFLSYFGVPSHLVEASIVTNTVYLRQIGEGIVLAIKQSPFGFVGLLILFGLVYWLFTFKFNAKEMRGIRNSLLIMLALFTLYTAHSFGFKLAESTTGFTTLYDCSEISSSTTKYIVPAIRGNSVVAVPINNENKMIGGFYLKDMSAINCKLEWKELGKIK